MVSGIVLFILQVSEMVPSRYVYNVNSIHIHTYNIYPYIVCCVEHAILFLSENLVNVVK